MHRSRVVDSWFRDHPDVLRMYWPARSPDLNPIENLWGRMVLDWDPANERNPTDLAEHAQRSWATLRSPHGARMCKKLVDSMPNRVRDVLECEGKYSKYYPFRFIQPNEYFIFL